MTLRLFPILAVLSGGLLAGCDSADSPGGTCLDVSPGEGYTLSGTAMTSNFTPGTKTYAVRNTCSEAVMLSVEEDVRWLDVDIAAFGGGGNEAGMLDAGRRIDVVVEVRYGNDNAERLNRLAPGRYDAELRFEDDTHDERVTRAVDLTVNAP